MKLPSAIGRSVDIPQCVGEVRHMGALLILASASPRRRELLAKLAVDFEVLPSDIPEIPEPNEAPEAFAGRVARDKARDVAERKPDAYVLGADTVVVIDGSVLGKPADRDDARRMLRMLSGRRHCVLTAVALIEPTGAITEFVVCSWVSFRELDSADIEAYLDTPEPYDKAGAYAVQGAAARFIARVEGSYSNVVGLPLEELAAMLRRRLPESINIGSAAT